MNRLRASLVVVAVAAAGIGGSLLVGRLGGMDKGDLLKLVLATLPSLAGTILAVAIAQPRLARASILWRMVTIATVAAVVSLANLVLASRMMFVSGHDTQVLGIMVAFSAAAGIGTALALARSSRPGVERLMATARRLGRGDLSARVGPLDAEPELRTLAATIDDMAARLARSIEQERRAEATRRDLFTAVSHDLRTPLSRVKAISEALEHGVVHGPGEVRRYIGEMRVSVESLIRLVEDLFELVHSGTGRPTLERPVPLRSVLDAAIGVCEGPAREKGITLRTELDGVAETPCPPSLERVLHNLLVNAVRHTGQGEVMVRGRLDGDEVVIDVSDTGEGMTGRQLHMAFEPFWRGDAARSSTGSGLGLTLARRLVEHLGGGIDVSSRPGEGSRFTVTIPVKSGSVIGSQTSTRQERAD
jgi:signal transduction histidine kinase